MHLGPKSALEGTFGPRPLGVCVCVCGLVCVWEWPQGYRGVLASRPEQFRICPWVCVCGGGVTL